MGSGGMSAENMDNSDTTGGLAAAFKEWAAVCIQHTSPHLALTRVSCRLEAKVTTRYVPPFLY